MQVTLQHIVPLDARPSRRNAVAKLGVSQLIHAQSLEGVPNKGYVLEGGEDCRYRVLVQKEPREHQENNRHRWGYLRDSLNVRDCRGEEHPDGDSHKIFKQEDRHEDKEVIDTVTEVDHVVGDHSKQDLRQSLQRKGAEKRRQPEGKNAVQFRGPLTSHNAELPRNCLGCPDGCPEGLIHREEEDNSRPVLQRSLREVHPEVHKAEHEREEKVERPLNSQSKHVPRQFLP
mmetsp:Transcript_1939/g.4075  ORF Transcript_1939/g.4075 Transcript_1939/m.4075 type:complete len:230 (-) Transcript_1939:536-1225(-)